MTRHPLDVPLTAGIGAEVASLLLIAATFAVPLVSANPMVLSVANQILIAVTAAFSVYIMMRMDLLTFAVPAFMAVGGYAVAIVATRLGVTDLLALTAVAFLAPALLALPLGILVLRLRGVYFVLVTFVLTEITQLVLFEGAALTGGANGIVGLPAVTAFGVTLADNNAVLLTTSCLALVGAMATAAVTRVFRQHFAAIRENELLAQSLGLVVWHHKALGFVVAAGVSGLAGFALVNMLMMAHPSSFGPLSSVTYIAYAIVGGTGSMLGPLVGAAVLALASDLFAMRGEYSQGLFGFLIVVVVLLARGGIVGTLGQLAGRLRRRRPAAFRIDGPVPVVRGERP